MATIVQSQLAILDFIKKNKDAVQYQLAKDFNFVFHTVHIETTDTMLSATLRKSRFYPMVPCSVSCSFGRIADAEPTFRQSVLVMEGEKQFPLRVYNKMLNLYIKKYGSPDNAR